MRKIIIIGTLHVGLTPDNELKEVLEEYNPDQILVEIDEKDLGKKKFLQSPNLSCNL